MCRRPAEFLAVHCEAYDPEAPGIETALERWQGSLSERLLAGGGSPDCPVVRLRTASLVSARIQRSDRRMSRR